MCCGCGAGPWGLELHDVYNDREAAFLYRKPTYNFVAAQLQNAEFIEVNDAGEAVYELILNQ